MLLKDTNTQDRQRNKQNIPTLSPGMVEISPSFTKEK